MWIICTPVKKGAFPDNGVRPHDGSNLILSIYYAVTPYLYCVYSLGWDRPFFLLNLNSTHTIYLRPLVKHFRTIENSSELSKSLNNQAKILREWGKLDEALKLAEEAYNMATDHGYSALAQEIKPVLDEIRDAIDNQNKD